jgi:hypothetical protein
MRFAGADATITDSVIHPRCGLTVNETSVVQRNARLPRDNTLAGNGGGVAFAVGGTGNTLDGNIVASREGGPSTQ